MDIESIKKIIREKIGGLSQREKIISFATVAVAAFTVFNMLLYSPASRKVKAEQTMAQSLRNEINAITIALASQPAAKKEGMPEKIVLPEAEDLSGMLAAISREANLAKVDFISITPEGFEYKDRFIELRVKIELRVRFRELYDFLSNIEARHKLFLVQDVKFETDNVLYPSGIAFLKAVTYLKKK